MIGSGDRVSPRALAYYHGRFRNALHDYVLKVFTRQQQELKLTRREMAHRIGKDPAQITKWLAAPGNWTLDTVSDLLIGMGIDPRKAIASLPVAETVSTNLDEHTGASAKRERRRYMDYGTAALHPGPGPKASGQSDSLFSLLKEMKLLDALKTPRDLPQKGADFTLPDYREPSIEIGVPTTTNHEPVGLWQ